MLSSIEPNHHSKLCLGLGLWASGWPLITACPDQAGLPLADAEVARGGVGDARNLDWTVLSSVGIQGAAPEASAETSPGPQGSVRLHRGAPRLVVLQLDDAGEAEHGHWLQAVVPVG